MYACNLADYSYVFVDINQPEQKMNIFISFSLTMHGCHDKFLCIGTRI